MAEGTALYGGGGSSKRNVEGRGERLALNRLLLHRAEACRFHQLSNSEVQRDKKRDI